MGTTAELVADVGKLLGREVTFASYLGRKGRAIVARVHLDDGGTVVVKGARRPLGDGRAVNDGWSPANRFRNEVATLGTLQGAGGLVPRLIAVDLDRQWIVLEDLGDVRSLATALLHHDPERAMRDLSAWATALGRLHRASADPEMIGRCESARTALGGVRPQESARSLLASVRPQLRTMVTVPADAEAAAAEIDRRLSDRRWWALTPRDACPDNCAIREDGSAILFDFEGGGVRHALLDAAYLVTTFPTCWCIGELPDDARRAGLEAYRAAAAWSLDEFDAHLAAAAAFHGLWVLDNARFADAVGDSGGSGWHWEDVGFDIPAARQVIALILDDVERAVEGDAALDAVGILVRSLRTALLERWGNWERPPPHPAFMDRPATR